MSTRTAVNGEGIKRRKTGMEAGEGSGTPDLRAKVAALEKSKE